eukprot:SAG31_NODE_1588_length_7818_cov_3.365462_2_plen_110_part_00
MIMYERYIIDSSKNPNWIAYLQYRKGNNNQYGWAKFSFAEVRALNVYDYIWYQMGILKLTHTGSLKKILLNLRGLMWSSWPRGCGQAEPIPRRVRYCNNLLKFSIMIEP